jgi:O-antigen biosynthesis protein
VGTLYKQNVDAVSHRNVKNWYDDRNPLVSIVILNFNKAHLTIECLKSLWQHTQEYSYEIIVVDNGSRAEDFSKLVAFKGAYQLLRLDINRYFGEGNNIGAELAKGEFLLCMNNDVTVTPEWLSPLMNAFCVYSDCGAAGPKFLYPDGSLQEAGALLDEEGGSVQIGKYQDPTDPRFNQSRVVDYVSAAAVLMRKKVFEDVLGFDYIYEPAYYEDVDLCLKIGQRGLKTYYIADSCVVHHENATTSDVTIGLQLSGIVETNRIKFIKRWQFFLATGRHLLNQDNTSASIVRCADRSDGKTAGIYTPYNIYPGGGERYLLSVAEHLIGAGYKTWLVLPEIFSALRISKLASIFNIDLKKLEITTFNLAKEMSDFDLFVVIGNEAAPPVKGLGRKNLYVCQFPFPCPMDQIDRRRGYMALYDAVIVYSTFSRKNMLEQIAKQSLPNLDIHVVSPPVDIKKVKAYESKKNIISVGRFFIGGHCKHQDILIQAFRRLHELGIDIELNLVGSLPSDAIHREYFLECKRLAQGLPVNFYVDASDENITSLYEESSIYWHGAGFGVNVEESPEKCEHFGISIIEAMSAGVIPIVVNNGGPASIVHNGVNGYCYDSEEELVELTMDLLYKDESRLSTLRANARARAEEFSKDLFSVKLTRLLKEFEPMLMENFLEQANEYAEKLKQIVGFDDLQKLWSKTTIPYDMKEVDPNSIAYKEEVLAIYKNLTKNSYSLQNEKTSTLQNSPIEFEQGFPWSTSNLGVICAESAKVVQCMRALQEADMGGKRIIEFGSGWGNLALPLAKSGLNMTVVDIDDGFLDRIGRMANRDNVNIVRIENDFIGACNSTSEKYDAVIFQSSFHHCIDFNVLLRSLKNKVLSCKGKIFFFSEPIFEDYRFPWGIRYDGESLWAVMVNKWLELGFDKSYFSELLLDCGFFLERIPAVSGYVGYGWRASQCEEEIFFDNWVLPKKFDSMFHTTELENCGGRFCRSISGLPRLKNHNKVYSLKFKNFSPRPINFSIAVGEIVTPYVVDAGKNCIVTTPWPVGEYEIVIHSDIFCPAELIEGNGDTRNLGIFLESIKVQDAVN